MIIFRLITHLVHLPRFKRSNEPAFMASPIVLQKFIFTHKYYYSDEMITIDNYRRKRQRFFQQAKPLTLHFSLLLVVLMYSMGGGMVFRYLEEDYVKNLADKEQQAKETCVHDIFNNATSLTYHNYRPTDATIQAIIKCFHVDVDPRNQWSSLTAAFYGFGIATTLGYNRLQPVTLQGRLFCILYGICGIPITMIIIANVGQYLHQFASLLKKNIEAYNKRRRASKANIRGEDIPDSSIEVTSIALLFVFLFYVAFGALLLPALNGEFDFWNGLYYNFITLTAIDFGHAVPKNLFYWPITFIYICFGLAITTIAIDIGAQYMKKLHHIGQKMKNVAQTKIWFGGKTLKVRDLLHAVGKKCGIDPFVIDNLDLENVVERTIALNEGKEPPPDTNEEPLPPKEPEPDTPKSFSRDENDNSSTKPNSEACPLLYQPSVKSKFSVTTADLVIQNPTFETVSQNSSAFAVNMMPFLNEREIVAIDIDVPEEFVEEPALNFENPLVVSHTDAIECPRTAGIALPEDLSPSAPIMVLEDSEAIKQDRRRSTLTRTPSPDAEPKKFKEKKEKYGRDPRKLYETYQEEWGRLERLSDKRLGSRRKSVLASPTASPLHASTNNLTGEPEDQAKK